LEKQKAEQTGLKNYKSVYSRLINIFTYISTMRERGCRRVINAVWSTTSRQVKYQVVAQLIEMIHADEEDDEEGRLTPSVY
jgi:CRISPR/Cas system type I-B associated protein Csh2 (Cas7 group RAMP superfamily)